MSLFNGSSYMLWLALENIHMYITRIQAVCEKCGCVVFPRAHHESVCKSVQCARREITDRKTWSPVSLYAFPLKLRIQVGLTFRRYSSSIFICAHIRVLLNRKERKGKCVFTEYRVGRSKMILLLVKLFGSWRLGRHVSSKKHLS